MSRLELGTCTSLCFLALLCMAAASFGGEIDIERVKPDLVTPPVTEGAPGPGRRVRQVSSDYAGSGVYHALYLPTDWVKTRKYPVIVEYAGNAWQTSPGTVDGSNLGYGISGGQGAIWVCMPFVDGTNRTNAAKWWGDVEATVEYCKRTVRRVCEEYGGDPANVFLAGFSRGAIACNFIGLHDDDIAALWRGFICHSHYEGVQPWPGSTPEGAAERLKRLKDRPQFISHERSVDKTRQYLAQALPGGNFTFQPLPFAKHTDTWVLRDIPERRALRDWFKGALANAGPQSSSRVAPDADGSFCYDLVIYGDSSAAVVAAIAAKRQGRSVILVNPTGFLGGMSASGLSATDFLGKRDTFTGIASEFYDQVAAAYGRKYVRSFEPHVGQRVFEKMFADAGVPVVFNERLDRAPGKGVRMNGRRIEAITTLSGRTCRGRMFIDATYVGDLLAAAGVTYTVGREPESQYGENLAGVRRGDTKPRAHYTQGDKDHFTRAVDPYLKPGDPASGLLPYVFRIDGLTNGQGDKKIQAYNYRLCLTSDPKLRIPIGKPDGYRESDHELLLRNFDAGDTRLPATMVPLSGAGSKVDLNHKHAVGSDLAGANWEYPEASYERRREIELEHERYIRGFLWTLANSPRVPEAILQTIGAHGLSRDEFTANGGWPYMIYIREARRMVSDYVMTQNDCEGKRAAPDPVGLGSFGMDSHLVQRFVTEKGQINGDGVIWRVPPRPYGISYRSIVPRRGECENLLVPVCLSATHVAHGSIRMEPVFMVLGQSAALAAGLAIEKSVSVQDVDYASLRARIDLPVVAAGKGDSHADAHYLENRCLRFELVAPDRFRLTNKLTGKSYDGSTDAFDLLVAAGGRSVRLKAADFESREMARLTPDTLVVQYEHARELPGLCVEVEYKMSDKDWFVRKRVRAIHGSGAPFTIREACVEKWRLDGVASPEKPENPTFLDGQLFCGLEWPIGSAAVKDGWLAFSHCPGASVSPGTSWESKVFGFGVSEAGRIKESLGRYIQEIRANKVDFATFYFDWLCHDNSGPLESEILANMAALKKLRELYGLQFDIYNSDAGLVEAPGTYFPQYRPIFEERFPNGLRTIADAAAELNMQLGLWIGPDGFGETPAEMKARQEQIVSWVRDCRVGLFKLDTVVSPLGHKDPVVLEKKYQALADALAEARRINPSMVVINHRVNESPYMLTLTDCLLWEGQETYVDVHIHNTTGSLYNRDCSINRDLTSAFYDVPFRQFEDHGICFNSCIEKWDNDLVAQAFGRASVLSPELYGTFFFLRDEDYPRLARLIQLHKQSERMLKAALPLPGGDVAHGDGRSALIVLRNPGWEPATKSVTLDASIGLKAAAGTPVTVRQRHPHELLLGREYKAGDTLRVDLDPWDLRMIQVDAGHPDEFFLAGIPYNVIPGGSADTFDLELLGEPGRSYEVSFHNSGERRFELDGRLLVLPGIGKAVPVRFAGEPVKGPLFSTVGDCTDVKVEADEAVRLAEAAKFAMDDEALEARELRALESRRSKIPEIEACRDYMRKQIRDAEATCRNAFDGDPATRWSDGHFRRTRFANRAAPYRSESSLWRIDFGALLPVARLELQIVRRTDAAFLESAEVSADLRHWERVEGLSLKATERIPFESETTRRGKTTKFYDVAAGDGAPVAIAIALPGARCRYVRIRGRDFSVSEIAGYDGDGKHLDRSRWKATNSYGESPPASRVLGLTHKLTEYWAGQELAVTVRCGAKKLDPVDGVLVAVAVDGKIHVPPQRAPSYPYHNFEASTSWLIQQGLEGMTFRLPTRPEWAGRKLDVRVLLSGDCAEGATACVRVVTPVRPASTRRMNVRGL